MEDIYIAFVDTPGFFASIIRKVLNQKYVHIVLSLDSKLEEAYSVGRRDPRIPIIAGFERERKELIGKAFPKAEYMICRMKCSKMQKQYIAEQLRQAYEKRLSYHYAVVGLPFILLQIPFFQKNHFTCSSYIAKLLEDAGVCEWEKDFSLVTPKDFYLRQDKQVLFEGKLLEFMQEERNAGGMKETDAKDLTCKVAYGQ